MVMGRKTYEGLAAYWTQETGPWADLLNPMPKFVASRTLHGDLDWNATLIDGDGVAGISRLKDELDDDLFLIGCGELARNLLVNGVVDEIRFWLHPAVWGEGARPFQGGSSGCASSTRRPTTRGSRSCATSRSTDEFCSRAPSIEG
jgi:dihydrofolate reductase